MFAYCFYCQTQRCSLIASRMEQRGIERAFAPQIIRRQRRRGKNEDRRYDLLPGYVFAYSEREWESHEIMSGIDGIIRRIGNPEHRWALTDGDRDFAMNLYRKDGVVGQITVFRVGDTVRLDDPLFNGCQGTVTQLDHRKGRARVDYRFAGMNCFTWIACELISAPEGSS